MGIFSTTLGLRRVLVELRGIRRALERTASVQELLALHATRPGGQSFRGLSHEKVASDGDGSGVTYVDPQVLERALLVETELITLLGRSPTADELDRALRGDIE